MDYKEIPQRVLRIIMACSTVFMILSICVCVGFCSALKTSVLNCVPFLRRRNVPEESVNAPARDEAETSVKQLIPPSSECSSPRSILNSTAEEKVAKDPMKSDRVSPKENLYQLEGLALQMVHLEKHRISADLPARSQSCKSFESPNKSPLVKKAALKGILKASSSLTLPTRSSRKIRFNDDTKYPSDRVTSGKRPQAKVSVRAEKSKVSSPQCLKKCVLLTKSPVKSSETETVINEEFPLTLKAENAPKIESDSDQQLAATENDCVSESADSTIITPKFEKSIEVGHPYFAQERMESKPKLKSGKKYLQELEKPVTASSENIDGTSSSVMEASLKTEDGKVGGGQASRTEDDVLQESEVESDQYFAEEHSYL